LGNSTPNVVFMNDAKHRRPSGFDETAPAGNASVIAAELTLVRCRWCNDDLEHCHESLVVHASGGSHCIEAACEVPTEAHHTMLGCAEFGCACAVTTKGIAETA
jgi:hypothetical protein